MAYEHILVETRHQIISPFIIQVTLERRADPKGRKRFFFNGYDLSDIINTESADEYG